MLGGDAYALIVCDYSRVNDNEFLYHSYRLPDVCSGDL